MTLLILLPAVGTMMLVLLIAGVASYELAAYRSIAHGTGLSSARAWMTAAAAFIAGWSGVALSALTCICGGGVISALIEMAGK